MNNLQPTLANELIILRPLNEGDFDDLFEVAKDPLIWEQHPCFDRYKKEVFSEFFVDAIKSKGAFIVIEKSNEKVIGTTRFKKINGIKNAVEIGWSFLSRDKWGGKYNKAMKKMMIDYAFKYVDHIIFYVGKDNYRSQRAIQKIGGEEITSPKFKYLIKESEMNLTFRIGKGNWKIQKEGNH